MIAKRIDMQDASKSRATRLAKYVTTDLERAGRVADVFTANCISDDALLAAKEIEICQARNTRANGDKTYHLLLSFPDGERPDKEQLHTMADATAKALGYGEHQRIAVVHDDIVAKIAHVTGRGTLFYRAGADVFRDNGSHVSLKREVTDTGIEGALRIAMAKFKGQRLTVNGSDAFKKRCIEAAARANLLITFSDARMEKERLTRLNAPQHIHSKRDRLSESSVPHTRESKTTEHESESKRGISR